MEQQKGVPKRFVERHLSPAVIYIILSIALFATLLVELYSPAFSSVQTLPSYFLISWTVIGTMMIALGLFALAVLALFYRRLKSVVP